LAAACPQLLGAQKILSFKRKEYAKTFLSGRKVRNKSRFRAQNQVAQQLLNFNNQKSIIEN
jgi:hypothetical protein